MMRVFGYAEGDIVERTCDGALMVIKEIQRISSAINRDESFLFRLTTPEGKEPISYKHPEFVVGFRLSKLVMSREEKWDRRFLEMARLVSTWSKDPSTKCGAVLVRPDLTVAAVGYNGFARGCDDADHLYQNREVKYKRVVHAELNAILSCREITKGYFIYLWPPGFPCDRCAVAIIQAGVKRVVYAKADSAFYERWKDSFKVSEQMFKEAGVFMRGYDVGIDAASQGGQSAGLPGCNVSGEQGPAGNS